MNQLSLFQIIEVIIRKYSKTSTRHLIDNYLRLKIIYNLSLSSLEEILSKANAPQRLLSVFTNRTKDERLINFSCIIISHPKLLHLTQQILEMIETCIVLDANLDQSNNIFSKADSTKNKAHLTKAILFRTCRENFDSLTESLDSYLSICELFHGHIHLIVNCFESWPSLALKEHMAEVEGDEFEGIVEEGYFKILEERGSKITLVELSEICEIQRKDWGQILIFEGGQDGIIVWITQRFLPKLETSPSVSIPTARAKQYLLFYSADMGYKIFKKKQLMKQKMHDMNFTTIVLNFETYSSAMEKAVAQIFDEYCKHFFSEVVMTTQIRLLEENIRHGQRACEILEINGKELLHKLLKL